MCFNINKKWIKFSLLLQYIKFEFDEIYIDNLNKTFAVKYEKMLVNVFLH